MMTKNAATRAANEYARSFPLRLEASVASNASSGPVGATVAYPPTAPVAFINQVQTAYEAAGWTVTVDGVAFTFQVS